MESVSWEMEFGIGPLASPPVAMVAWGGKRCTRLHVHVAQQLSLGVAWRYNLTTPAGDNSALLRAGSPSSRQRLLWPLVQHICPGRWSHSDNSCWVLLELHVVLPLLTALAHWQQHRVLQSCSQCSRKCCLAPIGSQYDPSMIITFT